jgi:zinc protease
MRWLVDARRAPVAFYTARESGRQGTHLYRRPRRSSANDGGADRRCSHARQRGLLRPATRGCCLGGAVGARLNSNIREEKGYSYGVFSSPELNSKAGTWRSWGTVQIDKTKESLAEFNKELLFISGEKPVTESELAGAKANRIRSYAQQFESLRRVADQVGELWALGLPLTELQREPAELEKASLSAVNAVASKYVKPANSMTLIIGELDRIEPGVREVMKGDIVTLDVEGNVVKK